jgi:hypothetical protein
VQHARTHAVSAVQCYSRFRQNSSSAESEAKNPAKTPDSPPSGAHHLPLPQPSEYCINVRAIHLAPKFHMLKFTP